MTHRFDSMTIWIEYEGAVVVGVILWPEPRRAIIPSAGLKRRDVEVSHGPSARRTETDMGAWRRRPDLGLARDRKFDPEGPRGGAVVGPAAGAEIDDADQSERPKRCVIESSAAIDVAYTE